jgi:hypothetical protein
LLGERKMFGVIRFTVTPGLLLTTVWQPLCCPSAYFQAARFWALFFRINFLLHRRGQKATSLANRGGIPRAGQLEIILTYWRIGAPISYTASLFANTTNSPRRATKSCAVGRARADFRIRPCSSLLSTPRPISVESARRPSSCSSRRKSGAQRESQKAAAGPPVPEVPAAPVARQLAEELAAPAPAELEAEVAAEEEVAPAADLPRRDATTDCGGGARAPGLGRHRRQPLVGVAASVRASTALVPKAAEYPGSGVQPEPGRSGVCTWRSAALDCGGLLSRSDRHGPTRDAARGERLAGIHYDKRFEVSSSDRLLACKRMFGRALVPYGPTCRPLAPPPSQQLPLQGRYTRCVLPFTAAERESTLPGVTGGRL